MGSELLRPRSKGFHILKVSHSLSQGALKLTRLGPRSKPRAARQSLQLELA